MRIEVDGARLWFDVEGPGLVPNDGEMLGRPTVILVHGGPGSYDHSYFKPDFACLGGIAQVVYLDLRDHGRSDWGEPSRWSFEVCADDLRLFCDRLGIEGPVVLGHSMGGFVAMLYGARHPGHARGLILQSTNARFDLERLVSGFARLGGHEVAELARRSYSGESVTDDEWARVFRLFGPNVPDPDQLARRRRNPAVAERGMELLRCFDAIDQLGSITSPTLVCVGELDPVTPVEASLQIVEALAPGIGRLEVIPGSGHFPWLDRAERYWTVIDSFIEEVGHR